ncbi:hypothetical protein [Dyadobacter sp. CY343]|uniref:hypothetical protein n=1 Tax=Dyadobacter sp. CY343 TaxID=2907299 RepID=UPI001F220C6B|nr:hypothetical protein [Dyadobacter sp. CY343]MCE7062178.1 hypothetical protein [Dyadobacter sp. CY343]
MNELYKPSKPKNTGAWYKNGTLWFIVGSILVAIMINNFSKEASKPLATGKIKNGQLDLPPMTDQQLAEVVEDMKKEEELRKEELKSFYKTKAGKINKKHPEWTREDCERLVDNQVWIGMSLDMLKYKRGLPNSANPSDYGNGVNWQWCWDDYTPSCFYDNNADGLVDSYN